MASVWGSAWGSAWGNSWGSVGAVVEPPVVAPPATGGGGMWGGASFHISEREVADMLRLLYPPRRKKKRKVEPEITAERLEAAAEAILNTFGPPPSNPAPLQAAAKASADALRVVQANRISMQAEVERFLQLAAALRAQEAERQRIADDEDDIELLLLSAA